MVTVSSAFISSRRERISLRVSSTSGLAFETTESVEAVSAEVASAEVLGALDLTVFDVVLFGADEDAEDEANLDNTGAVRDHFLSLYRERRILGARRV
jgi:hypothetical protein